MNMKRTGWAALAILMMLALACTGALAEEQADKTLFRPGGRAIALCLAPNMRAEEFPIGMYFGGVSVKVLDTRDEWLWVSIGGDGIAEGITGFVWANYVVDAQSAAGKAGVLPEGETQVLTALRLEASDASRHLAELSAGTTVQLLGDLGDWYHVQAGDQLGFLPIGDVTVTGEALARLNKASPPFWAAIDPIAKKKADKLDMMVAEKKAALGNFDSWPLEEKAWYSDAAKALGLTSSTDTVYMMPGERDLSLDRAQRIAEKHLADAYVLWDKELESLELRYSFEAQASDRNNPVWEFKYYLPGTDTLEYSVTVYARGGHALNAWRGNHGNRFVRLCEEIGPIHTWTMAQQEQWGWMEREAGYGIYGFVYGQPDGVRDMEAETAIAYASRTLKDEKLDGLVPYAALNVGDSEAPVWHVDFWPEDEAALYPVYQVTVTSRGEPEVTVLPLEEPRMPVTYEQVQAWRKERSGGRTWVPENEPPRGEPITTVEGDMQKDAALRLAIGAVMGRYGLTDSGISRFTPSYTFVQEDDQYETPYWRVDLTEKMPEGETGDHYTVIIGIPSRTTLDIIGPDQADK